MPTARLHDRARQLPGKPAADDACAPSTVISALVVVAAASPPPPFGGEDTAATNGDATPADAYLPALPAVFIGKVAMPMTAHMLPPERLLRFSY